VTKRKAGVSNSALTTSGISALLLLGAWCCSALASTETVVPRQEMIPDTDTSLRGGLEEELTTSPTIRTVESSDEQDDDSNPDDAAIRNTEIPDIATRLPGVSASDLPRFRRHMFRTDI